MPVSFVEDASENAMARSPAALCQPNNPRAPSKQATQVKQAAGRVAGNGSNGCMENSASNRDQLQNLETDNPAVSFKLMDRHMDAPAASLPLLQCYAWNLELGLSDQPAWVPDSPDIANIVFLAETRERARVFFAEIHPVYNFLDQQEISSGIFQ
ncbi:Hypothetical protein PENO1_065420 [Penicillium occitanis (nom. inval.)]|nr:Hypothetical protein PENO1_065420 [Penicillium occitanis (nom. inval.)]PCG97392.1 hypothetical protein PENOC_068100 [Penicillium occitanis (nom. inval.)]